MAAIKQQKLTARIVREDGFDVLCITTEGRKSKTDYYAISRNRNAPSAWRLVRLAHTDEDEPATPYDILLNGDNSHCDCLAGLQYGRCKHVTVLTELDAAGKLPK